MDRELSVSELKKLNSKKGLISLLSKDQINVERTLRYIEYERKLIKLQTEVIKLKTWAINNSFGENLHVYLKKRTIKEV